MHCLSLKLVLLLSTTAATAQTQDWVLLQPPTSPPEREFQGMAFDFLRQHTVMFGGQTGGRYARSYRTDTWTWNGKVWTRLRPATSPSGRAGHAMAYDLQRRRIVLFGGQNGGGRTLLGDTWTWDGTTWTQLQPASSPSPRAFHMMAHDDLRGRTVLFGGIGNDDIGDQADTWEWDGTRWTRMYPKTSPLRISTAAMAYDLARKRVVLFGGLDSNRNVLDQTWEWDGVDWRRIPTPVSPAPRMYPGMTYDRIRRRIVMFGGDMRSDTWQYDGHSWVEIPTENAPLRRYFVPAMTYDPLRRRSLLFSGVRGLNDTWEFGGDAPTLLTDVDTIAIAKGGVQQFTLQPGPAYALQPYRLLGSMTGTDPGTTLTGIHIPLNPDLYTDFVFAAGGSRVFQGFQGVLDAGGQATAALHVAANLPIPPGFALHHAFVVFHPGTGRILMASHPARLEFR